MPATPPPLPAPGPPIPPTGTEVAVCILGAGPHGLSAAVHLVNAKPELARDLVVVDPAGTWMHSWHEQFARLAIDNLRSPVVHHLGTHAGELAEHVGRRGLDRSGLPYDLPTTAGFASYCDELVAVHGLAEPLAARARHIDPTGDGLDVATDAGTIRCRHLIIASNPHRRVIPDWVTRLVGWAPNAVDHAVDVDLRYVGDLTGETVVIIGGGLTAAHLAVGAVERGARVELVSRRQIEVRSFDTEPGWLGPMHLDGYAAQPDPHRRHRQALAARGGGTVPGWMHHRLVAVAAHATLRLHEGRRVVASGGSTNGAMLDLDDGTALAATRVWLATGTTPDITADRSFEPVLSDMATVAGFPVCDRDLRAGRRPIHVMGRLATLTLGPAAGNLWGAQRAARRITRAITGVDLDHDTFATVPMAARARAETDTDTNTVT